MLQLLRRISDGEDQMLIRPTLEHLDQLVDIAKEYHLVSRFKDSNQLSDDAMRKWLETIIPRPQVFFEVLEIDGKIHGGIIGAIEQQPWNTKNTGVIPFIFLDECCRGRGYAEQMIENAKAWGKANNCYEIITSDYAIDPGRTAKWYESIGFENVGVTYAIKI